MIFEDADTRMVCLHLALNGTLMLFFRSPDSWMIFDSMCWQTKSAWAWLWLVVCLIFLHICLFYSFSICCCILFFIWAWHKSCHPFPDRSWARLYHHCVVLSDIMILNLDLSFHLTFTPWKVSLSSGNRTKLALTDILVSGTIYSSRTSKLTTYSERD